MAVRFYIKGAADTTSGLPTAEQSTKSVQTSSRELISQANNYVMQTSIGTAQVSTTADIPNNSIMFYMGRWVSPALNLTSFPASDFILNFAAREESLASGYPVNGNSKPLWVNVYIWRISTASKIGTILDGNTNSVYNEPSAANTEKVMHGTFSGAAVSNLETTDRLILEIWTDMSHTTNQNWAASIYLAGTTVNTTANTTVSNHASFLEYEPIPTTVDASLVSAKSLVNKFITKV